MARIDGILRIVLQQKGTELRVAAGRPPELTRDGEPLKFTLPVMSEPMLMSMVEDLLTEEQADGVARGEEVVFSYGGRGIGTFWLKLQGTGDALELVAWPHEGGDEPSAGARPPSERPVPTPEPAFAPAEEVLPPEPVASGVGAALSALLYRAAAAGASDLHLATGEPPTVRIGGRLRRLQEEPVSTEALLAGLLGSAAREQLSAGRSVDLALDVEDIGRFRGNLYHCEAGLAAAFRVLRRSPPPLASLGLPGHLRDLADLPHGLVLVCGPTGSGKSTTLAALAQERVRQRPTLLLTLEEPIEYGIDAGQAGSLVRQREVGRHVADFVTGLRDALREDPDVLLIGEMRDADSIALALTAAETGHLVLASLHSRSAASAVERIVDVYPPERQGQIRVQLADALQAVVAQRLLPTTSGAARTPAVEVLRVNHSVANLIREGRTAQIQSAIQSGGSDGMVSMERALADLVRSGQVRRESARGAANDPGTLETYLRS